MCLHTPLVEHATPLAQELLAARQRFLSKLIYQTYNGYVMSQFKKLEQDLRARGEIKWKRAMHLMRPLLSGIITNYVATVEVKIPFSLVGLPDRLPDGVFDLQAFGTPGDPFALQSTPDLFGWTELFVGSLPGYTIRLSDTNAGFNPVRFYRVFSYTPAP